MASQESQGLKIGLIVFAILWVICAVCAGLFYKWWDEDNRKAADQAKAARDADQKRTDTERRLGLALQYIGFGGDEKEDIVKSARDGDMEKFSSNFPKAQFTQDQQNYRHLVEYLFTEVRKVQKDLDGAVSREEGLKQKLAAAEADNRKKEDTYVATVKKTGDDLAQERTTFKGATEAYDTKASDINTKANASRVAADQTIAIQKKELAKLTKEVETLRKNLASLNELHADKSTAAELADGRIVNVNQKTRVVWLNVGRADGLQRQVTFNVIGSEVTNPGTAKPKGKVEVTQLLMDHLSEARILDDNISNPILPQDLIYSGAWQPGKAESFGIAGWIDVNRDQLSDHQLIVNLIQNAGGVVDAEQMDDGARKGKLTVNTRYLVQGDIPNKVAGDTENSNANIDKARKEYSRMLTEAQDLGIKVISVREFLDHIGYRADERATALGKSASPKDFTAPPIPGQHRSEMEEFRRRVPRPEAETRSNF
jgi:hypothetical protein